jgi:indole-3-glycerol phosphate synthase
VDKLAEIMAWKRVEIADRVRPVADAELAAAAARRAPRGPSFASALRRPDGLAVIAEVKRASPSAGAIRSDIDAVAQARAYADAGADALSVLTDAKYFGGELRDLERVVADQAGRDLPVPAIRKDFMVHRIQVLEAVEAGARAILIIVRALDDGQIRDLHDAARAAGLDALFEVHDEAELARALAHRPALVGVNNRNLSTFTIDLAFAERVIPLMPREVIKVAESGIRTEADAARMRQAGADALLVGESLMRADDPGGLLRRLRGA